MTTKIPCTVEILTLNSGKSLEKCLESVKDFEDIIILDGNSTDDTILIAQKYGARIFPQKETNEKNVRIDNFSEVRNKGITLARYKWFTFIDSDEYLSSEAVSEMNKIIAKGEKNEFLAFRRPRKYVVNGEIIDRATTYPNYQLRFFYLPATTGFEKKVHEAMRLKPETKIGILTFPEYVPLPPLDVAKKKWQGYLDMQQEALRDLSFGRLIRGIRSNTKKTIKYTLKYCWISIFKKGKKMPFGYEFYNALYHVQLMGRMLQNYYLKIVHK